MTRPHVQLLYLPDCPNYQPTRELIEQTGRELGLELDLELIAINDEQTAHRHRFQIGIHANGDDFGFNSGCPAGGAAGSAGGAPACW